MRTDLERPLKFKDLLRSAAFAPAYFVASGAVLVAVMYASWFGLQHGLPLSKDPGDWGTFGDYFGGVMNPICAYMAFVWLVRSYALQKTELAETRMALERSQQAQQLQAETSYAASRIEATNIHINVVGVQAGLQRESIAELRTEMRHDTHALALYHGVKLPIQDVISQKEKELWRLEEMQRELFAKIVNIEVELEQSWNRSVPPRP